MKGSDFLFFGAIFGGLAVLIGAFGAHWLQNIMTEEEMISFQKASFYHFIHAIMLTFVGYFYKRRPKSIYLAISGYGFILGLILFAFPLYVMNIFHITFIAFALPLGGISFTVAWFSLAIAAYKKSS